MNGEVTYKKTGCNRFYSQTISQFRVYEGNFSGHALTLVGQSYY